MSNPGPVLSAGATQRVADAIPSVTMRSTILGWFRPLTIGFVQQKVVNGLVETIVRNLSTSGVLQPEVEELNRYSEGGRSWKKWTLHCFPNIVMATNDRITVKGGYYDVMGKTDYSDNGFVIYHLVEAPHTYGA